MSKVTTIFAASALLFGISVFCYAQTLPKSMVQTMTYAEATKHSEFLLPKSIPAFISNTAIEKAIVTVLKVPETDGTHEFIIVPGYAQIRVMSPYFDEGSFTIGSEYIPGARLLSKQVIGGELKISDGTAFYEMDDIKFATWQTPDWKVVFVDSLSAEVTKDRLAELAKALQIQ